MQGQLLWHLEPAACMAGHKVPLLCILHAKACGGTLLHPDLAMCCFQGQGSRGIMLMAKTLLAQWGYRIAGPETFAFLPPQELRGGITSARRCLAALQWWLQALQHCWWVVAN